MGVSLQPLEDRIVVKPSEGEEMTVIAYGSAVHLALEAAHALDESIEVIDLRSLCPLDTEAILRTAGPGRLVVTAENHTVVGGLAESVAATLAFAGQATRVVPIALPDAFLAAGALPTLHDRYGLSTDAVVARIKTSDR